MQAAPPFWLRNWLERHQHPVSRGLHYLGIPLAVAAVVVAVVQLANGSLNWRPLLLLVVGYVLQYIGHRIEGNDMGEVVLVKRILGQPYCAVAPRYLNAATPDDSATASAKDPAVSPPTAGSPRQVTAGAMPGSGEMRRRTVAIVGASADRRKFGNKSVRAHLDEGWEVYPVNPRGGEIEGLPVRQRLEDVPVPLTRVSLYLPPESGIKMLPSIAAVRPVEFYVNPGAESAALLAEARRLGLEPVEGCSILALGRSPQEYPHTSP